MKAIDTMTAVKGAGLGFLLSALNPKNLIMAAGAGLIIGGTDASLDTRSQVLAIAIFTVIAAASVAVPVIAYLVASDRMGGPLESMHQWLVKENATVMAVLLLVIGVTMVGKGLGSF
jgi:threonine/homoserine/homoserine lactone efflux protein